jgi:RNA methyltransferase, TrmH family
MHENKPRLVEDFYDPRYSLLRSLRTPQGRARTSRYLIEGIRHLVRAVEARAPIESIFLDPSVLSNAFGQKLVRRLQRSGLLTVRLSRDLYRNLTLAAEPQGIGAVLRQHWTPLEAVQPTRQSFWLAVESIDSPGNLGTMIRTAEAAGVQGVFILSMNTDPWDPATVRASMGSLFSQRLVRCTSVDLVAWARNFRVALVGSSPGGLLPYKSLPQRWPAVLMIGAERHGLTPMLVESSDFMVRIPMRGRCDSINAAVAAGVLLFEMASGREGP